MTIVRLAEVLNDVWAARDPDRSSKWLEGLEPSDVRRTLMRAVASRRLGIPAPSLRERGRLDGGDRFDALRDGPALLAWFHGGDGWEVVEAVCLVAGRLKRTAVAALRGTGAQVTGSAVGSWALGVVGSYHWITGTEPPEDVLAVAVAEYAGRLAGEGPLRGKRLSHREFEAVAAPCWEQWWPSPWPAAGFAPAELGLGHDRRPPLSGPPGNWQAGTDRSVARRYARYFDARSRSRLFMTDHLDQDRHVTRRFLAAARAEIVLTEVGRACRPIGLGDAGHAAAVVAVSRAVRPGRRSATSGRAAPGPVDLDDWAEEDGALPVEPDDRLTAAAAAYFADWIANCRLAGRLDVGGNQVFHGVVRRMWHRLHGRELEWEVPHGRTELVALVKMCLSNHLLEQPAGVGFPDDPAFEDQAPDDRAPGDSSADGSPPAATSPPPVLDPREDRTSELVNTHPDGLGMVRRLLDGDPAWAADYAVIVPSGPEHLNATGFRAYCAGYGVHLSEES